MRFREVLGEKRTKTHKYTYLQRIGEKSTAQERF